MPNSIDPLPLNDILMTAVKSIPSHFYDRFPVIAFSSFTAPPSRLIKPLSVRLFLIEISRSRIVVVQVTK